MVILFFLQKFTEISTKILAKSPLFREVLSYQKITCYTSINHYSITTQSSWVSIPTTHINAITIYQALI
jgi:hypothetical protein